MPLSRPHHLLGTPAALVCCLLLVACTTRPTVEEAEGLRTVHEESGFSVVAPETWQVNKSGRGLILVRLTPYGGGFPTLNIRRVTEAEAAVLSVSGPKVEQKTGRISHRYQRWTNSRGQGYRLQALVRTETGLLFSDASIWDPSPKLNRAFFEEEFWPILNSLKVQAN
jgi:hypothetical protein